MHSYEKSINLLSCFKCMLAKWKIFKKYINILLLIGMVKYENKGVGRTPADWLYGVVW